VRLRPNLGLPRPNHLWRRPLNQSKMADARIRILFGQRETIKEFEREFWGMTLLGETKREVPVRTEPHPTLSFRSSPARPLIFRTIHGRR
jgi:hypothetical protein